MKESSLTLIQVECQKKKERRATETRLKHLLKSNFIQFTNKKMQTI
ncbi:hypothetical protein QY97_01561 [Bacillus thermotolerans]|nr:hypothetical protein QY97_01561 [Bacillus thermotolerans]